MDIGTTGLKAVAINEEGQVCAERAVRYSTRFSGLAAEQDAEAWWKAACRALPPVVADRDVRCITVTSQAPTLVAVDAAGTPRGAALTWIDRRATAEAAEIAEIVGTPTRNGADPYFGTAKLLWWARNRPSELTGASAVLHANGFLIRQLAAVESLDESSASLMQAWGDGPGAASATGWAPSLTAAGVPVSLLPTPVPSTAVVGSVTRQASAATGVPIGTPVAAGGIDAIGSALEAGVLAPGDPVAEMTGFSSVAMTAVPRGTHVPGLLIHTRHCVPGVDLLIAAQVTVGAVVDWLRQLAPSPDLLDPTRLADRPRPGRVLLFPAFAGERTPTWNAKARGAILGLDLDTDSHDLLLAIFEGTALALRDSLELMSPAGQPVASLLVTGGAARNEVWCRVKADVLGCPVHVPTAGHGAAVGAAMLAGLAVGYWPDAQEIRRISASIDRSYEPDEALTARYTERLAQFRTLRTILSDLSNGLAAVSASSLALPTPGGTPGRASGSSRQLRSV